MKQDRFSFIRYANCWEDTDILLDALRIRAGEVGLSVCSGGDNTLSLLMGDPREVVAFDVNPTQLYCLQFKMAALRMLDRPEVLALLGVTPCEDRLSLFGRIKPAMDGEARAFFEANPAVVRDGLIHAGKFEHYFQLFRRYLLPLVCSQKKLRAFLSMEEPAAQKAFYDRHIDNLRLRAIVKVYFGAQVMGALGRDKSFFDFVEEKHSLGDEAKRRVEQAVSHTPNASNAYLHYVFLNRFTPHALPHYLRVENFDTVRARLDRIRLVRSDLEGMEGGYDFFNLSDIFEYMSPADFASNVRRLRELANPGARLAYWNMQNRQYIKNVDNGFACDEALSEALYRRNQSCFYRDFSVYERKNEA